LLSKQFCKRYGEVGMRRTLTQLRVFLETNPYTAGATARLSRRARIAVFLYRLSLRISGLKDSSITLAQQVAILEFRLDALGDKKKL